MLKRVGQTEMEKNHVTPEGAMIRIKDASYPAPFHPGLEFNSPVHGNWNIVHTGMLMPETIQTVSYTHLFVITFPAAGSIF